MHVLFLNDIWNETCKWRAPNFPWHRKRNQAIQSSQLLEEGTELGSNVLKTQAYQESPLRPSSPDQ